MIEMIQDKIKVENKWATHLALKMQELWIKEIDQAIKAVKFRVSDSKCKSHK